MCGATQEELPTTFICHAFSVHMTSHMHVTVLVRRTYRNYSYKITRAIRATIGVYVHVRICNFTIMPPLTKGYVKISIVLVFVAARVLPRRSTGAEVLYPIAGNFFVRSWCMCTRYGLPSSTLHRFGYAATLQQWFKWDVDLWLQPG
jgi:hypothetical protein